VNPVYGKMPVNRKLRSRETRRSILYIIILYTKDTRATRNDTRGTELVRAESGRSYTYSGVSKVNLVCGKTYVKSDFMQSRDAKTGTVQY
jgi:hypothetical protein